MTNNTDPVRALIELRTGVEMDAAYDPMGAAKLEALDAAIAAFASTPPGAHSDDLPTLLDNLMRAAYDDGDWGLERFSGETIAAREAVLAHVRGTSAPPSATAGVDWVMELADEYDAKGQHERAYYLRIKAALAARKAAHPAVVDEAMVERIAALLYEEETDEPWTVAGVEHPVPDRDYYRELARKVLALASALPSAPSDDLPTLLDNLMRAAFDDGDRGREKFSCATMAAREAVLAHVRAVLAHVRGASAPPSAPVGVDFAAVAAILRRAMRDGVHYGYRRDFILQQALALEALSQQPAGAPVGWRLVPVEPSEAMLDAGSQWNNEMDVPPTYAALRCIWRDMLAAAPTPPPLPDHFAAQQGGAS